MQYSTAKVAKFLPGHVLENGRRVTLRTYTPKIGGTKDKTVFKINLGAVTAAAAAGLFVTLTVTPPASCCTPPIEIKLSLAKLIEAMAISEVEFSETVLCAIKAQTRINGYGITTYNPVTDEFTFESRLPGFPVDWEITAPAGVTITKVVTPAAALNGARLIAGTPVVIMPPDFEGVMSPSQNVALPASAQRWVGIVADCGGFSEQAPVSGGYPSFSNCDSPCQPPQTCVQVLSQGPIGVLLEKPSTTGKVYYRFSGGESGFTGVPDAGTAEIPVPYSILSAEGNLISLNLL